MGFEFRVLEPLVIVAGDQPHESGAQILTVHQANACASGERLDLQHPEACGACIASKNGSAGGVSGADSARSMVGVDHVAGSSGSRPLFNSASSGASASSSAANMPRVTRACAVVNAPREAATAWENTGGLTVDHRPQVFRSDRCQLMTLSIRNLRGEKLKLGDALL